MLVFGLATLCRSDGPVGRSTQRLFDGRDAGACWFQEFFLCFKSIGGRLCSFTIFSLSSRSVFLSVVFLCFFD